VSFKRDELTGRLPDHNPFVRDLMNHAGPEKLPHYLRAATQMIAGMRSAESIDRFIDRNADDEFIRTLGKAAIVEAIAFKEFKSRLSKDNGAPTTGRSPLDDTWYWTFVKMLLEGSPPKEELFKNVAIVCFNYDRCIEHYLICELMRSYHIDRKEAANLVARLSIWHPYGTIAPFEVGGVNFGDNQAIRGRTFQLANRIKTFTEKVEDRIMVGTMHACISSARTLVFLGFGYYKQNLELIAPSVPPKLKWILGTGHGLSDSDRYVVEQERLGTLFKTSQKIEVKNMKCAELLTHYRMALSA